MSLNSVSNPGVQLKGGLAARNSSEGEVKGKVSVTFIEVFSVEDKLAQVLRLGEELVLKRRRALFLAPKEELPWWDTSLWTFTPDSFIPHAVWPCKVSDYYLILSAQPIIWEHFSTLFLPTPRDSSISPWMLKFKEVVEFADKSDGKQLKLSRTRYKKWKELGITPKFQQKSQKNE